MEPKDLIAIVGIAVTLAVSVANLVYSVQSNRKSVFVNTVTASRLKWIESLRDKVSEFIAVTARLSSSRRDSRSDELLLERDTLLHQIALHLNPLDPEDQRIRSIADEVRELTDKPNVEDALATALLSLRTATGNYLKKEWNRVKAESGGARS